MTGKEFIDLANASTIKGQLSAK